MPKRARLFLLAAFCVLAAPVATRLVGFTSRAGYHMQIMANEGWNAYYGRAAANGVPLYGEPPGRLSVNYPPLSFHIVGKLGKAIGDMILAGRILSWISFLWVGVCVAYIVRRISGDAWGAAFAALFWIGLLVYFAPPYVATDDPQMLAHALCLTASAVYVSGRESDHRVAASCVLFCVAGFVKHNLLAFPLAVTIDLLLTSRRRLAIWALTGSVTVAVLAGFTYWQDGPHLIDHLLAPRIFRFSRARFALGIILRVFFFNFAVCGIRCFHGIRERQVRLLALAFLISFAEGAFFVGGAGTSFNLFFETVISMAMLGGLILSETTRLAEPGSLKWTAATAMLLLLFSFGPGMTRSALSQPPGRAELAQAERDFLADVQFLRDRPGPAICFDLRLCYEAGKPMSYDPFMTGQRMATGKLDPSVVAAELRQRQYSVVQAEPEPDLFFEQEELLVALKESYRVEPRNSAKILYVPKEEGR